MYDTYLPITYILDDLTDEIEKEISNLSNNVVYDMQRIIERGYFIERILPYSQFEVVINAINNYKVTDIDSNSWIYWQQDSPIRNRIYLDCQINCLRDQCVFISGLDMTEQTNRRRILLNTNNNQTDDVDCDSAFEYFQPMVQCNFAQYFDENSVKFTVQDADILSSEMLVCSKNCANDEEAFDYVFVGTMAFLGLMALISVCAYLFNKGCLHKGGCFYPVDNAAWTALLIFGVQAWDFIC